MSKKIPSQDSNFEPKIAPLGSCYNYNKLKKKGLVSEEKTFEEIWREMDAIEPLTPPVPTKSDDEKSLEAYREAAKSDAFLFGDYDAFQAYGIEEG